MRKYLYAILSLAVLPLAGCFGPATTGPRAVIATDPSPAQGPYPFTVAFDASRSQGDIAEYLWAFGDGTTGTGHSLTHTYEKRGTYTVYLTVVARDGTTGQTSTTVHVHSQRPVARFTISPPSAKVGEPFWFDASTSYDPDGQVAEYLWNFGDGKSETTTVPYATHRYGETGRYTVTLVVKDEEGDLSDPELRPLEVVRGGCCGN
ncbi:MAG TPA: PKD domain-containing protein [Candidatus Acetothermia bacterium]|nr:PKD domain-containing protein [Candidatus Acetothermia bacterium]